MRNIVLEHHIMWVGPATQRNEIRIKADAQIWHKVHDECIKMPADNHYDRNM
jgi:hypothetical protein